MIDCCVASAVSLLEDISSSSLIAVTVAPLANVSDGAVTAPTNVALPPSDISNVNASINDPLSLPTILISLSATLPISLVSPPSFTIEKKFVPPSPKLISAPSASKLISPLASNVKLVALI